MALKTGQGAVAAFMKITMSSELLVYEQHLHCLVCYRKAQNLDATDGNSKGPLMKCRREVVTEQLKLKT